MTKRVRNILIFLFGIVFFIGAPTALLYSQGYRIDFENKDLVQTGGFYFKIKPKPYKVYLNDELKKESGLLSNRIFLKNIFPKTYNIKIIKEEYFPWEKNLPVKEGLVTEAKSIILFPKNFDFSVVSREVKDFFFSSDQKKTILIKYNQDEEYLEMLNLKEDTQKTVLHSSSLNYSKIQFLNVEWGPENKKILLETEVQEENKYFILHLDEDQAKIFPLNYLNGARKISLSPDESPEVIFLKDAKGTTSLFKSNYLDKQPPVLLINEVNNYSISGENIFWFSPEGFLYQTNLSGQILKIFNTTPPSFDKESPYQLLPLFNDLIFVHQKNSLFQLDTELKRFEKIVDSSKIFKISPDYRKVVFSDGHEIKVLFLEEILGQPQREAHQEISLFRFSGSVNYIYWLNSNYLIFQTGDSLKISEIDSRNQINCYDIGKFKNSQLYLNNQLQKLFIISDDTFYSSSEIVF